LKLLIPDPDPAKNFGSGSTTPFLERIIDCETSYLKQGKFSTAELITYVGTYLVEKLKNVGNPYKEGAGYGAGKKFTAPGAGAA